MATRDSGVPSGGDVARILAIRPGHVVVRGRRGTPRAEADEITHLLAEMRPQTEVA